MQLPPLTNEEVLGTNIIAELGLEALPEERRMAIIQKLTDLVQQRVMLKIAETMSDADAQALQSLIEEKGESDQAVVTFISEKVPGLADMVLQEVTNVKQELIAHMNQAEG